MTETDEQTVVYRSAVTAVQLERLKWQYHFTITLEDGTERAFTGIVRGMEYHALAAGICRSGRMIDKGYQEGM